MMTNLFEQPWLLLSVAVIVLLVLVIVRDMLPQKHRWFLWLLPVLIAASAFALDFFIQTNNEKIKQVLAEAVKAVEDENVDALDPLISGDYQDSFHGSRQALLSHSRSQLSEPIIEKNVLRIVSLNIEPPNAVVVFTVRVVFDAQGPIYEFRKQMVFKLQADFRREGDNWLFARVELLEIDLQPVNWENMNTSADQIL